MNARTVRLSLPVVGQGRAVPIREGIHFLFNDVRRRADTTCKNVVVSKIGTRISLKSVIERPAPSGIFDESPTGTLPEGDL